MSAVTPEQTGKGILLKADPIAATFLDEVKQSIAQRTPPPKLVGILSTSAAPSQSYAEFTKKQCQGLGIDFVLKKTGAALSSDLQEGEGAEEAIIEANDDSSVDGVMVCRYASCCRPDRPFCACAGVLSHLWRSAGPLSTTGSESPPRSRRSALMDDPLNS